MNLRLPHGLLLGGLYGARVVLLMELNESNEIKTL
jgi:hypothetical protein